MSHVPWSMILPTKEEQDCLIRGVISKRVIPPTPRGRRNDAADCDLGSASAAPGRVAGHAVHIVYSSASGRVTERTVTLRKFSQADGFLYFYAFCHFRGELRQFRTDRVLECVDIDTGEVFDGGAYLQTMYQRLAMVGPQELEDFVRVLTYMMHCDGYTTLEEHGAVYDAIGRYCLRADASEDDYNLAYQFARHAAPEGIDFLGALRRIIRSPRAEGVCGLLNREIEAVIEADFVVHDIESSWQMEVVKALRRRAAP